jgi:hypothetical protein
MENKAYIYKKYLKITGKYYIGQHNGNDPNYYGSGIDWKKDIIKYNVDWNNDIETEILEYIHNLDEINKKEKFWLEYFNAANNDMFYNKSNKPFGPLTHTKKVKKILSNKLKGKKREGIALENIRRGHKKRILNINGEKISNAKKNHECYKNPERGRKISESNKGRKDSLETRIKKSKSLLGKKTKPSQKFKEYDLNNKYLKKWNSAKEIISYYKLKGMGFDYTTFLKKMKLKKPYKGKLWEKI